MRALVFPSQGFETPGMGLAQAEQASEAARLLDLVGARAGIDPRAVLARGGPALRRQEVLQPLTLAVSLGSVLAVSDVAFVAGHSLGELGALVFAGALEVDDALAFAAARGRIMGAATRERPGGIVAVRATAAQVETHLAAVPDLAVAARNTAESWSLCGPPAALVALSVRVNVTPVTNAGAWHHPAHATLVPAVRPLLTGIAFAHPRVEVFSAHTDLPITAAALPELLLTQLSTPVEWFGVVSRLVARGVTEVIVAEPSRQIAGMIREIAPALRVVAAAALSS